MWEIRFGPSRVPSRESPAAGLELLVERGYAACEVDFANLHAATGGGFRDHDDVPGACSQRALARCDRPATLIGESPDEDSYQAIRAVLLGQPAS
jgi:hypothetical protein